MKIYGTVLIVLASITAGCIDTSNAPDTTPNPTSTSPSVVDIQKGFDNLHLIQPEAAGPNDEHVTYTTTLQSASAIIDLDCPCNSTTQNRLGIIAFFHNATELIDNDNAWVAIKPFLRNPDSGQTYMALPEKGNLGQVFIQPGSAPAAGTLRLSIGDYTEVNDAPQDARHARLLIMHNAPDNATLQVNVVWLDQSQQLPADPVQAVQFAEFAKTPRIAEPQNQAPGAALAYISQGNTFTIPHLPDAIFNAEYTSVPGTEILAGAKINAGHNIQAQSELLAWNEFYYDYRVAHADGTWSADIQAASQTTQLEGRFVKGYATGSPTELLGPNNHPTIQWQITEPGLFTAMLNVEAAIQISPEIHFRFMASSIDPAHPLSP